MHASTSPVSDRGPWVLALDVGSSSVRAQLYDRASRPLAAPPAAKVRHRWRAEPDGAMETDGDALFAAVVQAIDGGIEVAREHGIEIAAVAAAAFWHGVMGVDAAGTPVTPLYGWGDTRAREAAARFRQRIDAEGYHRRTGCFVHEVYPAAKLVWLREAAGDTFPRAAAWVSTPEHLIQRLFGVRRTSLSMASGTGLLDVCRSTWDAETLGAIGIEPHHLPELSDEPLRGLLPEWARRWPELAAVPWFPALGDGACANLGSGAAGRDRISLTVGTSAAVRVLREEASVTVPDALWCYRLDARRAVAGRALSNGGNGFAWLRRTLALPPSEELERELMAMKRGAHGLSIVPALMGERPPLEDAAGSAVIRGMTPATTPVEIVRAWLEAVADRIADAVGAVEAAFGPAAQVIASGGALHDSPAFARIVEEALGRALHVSDDHEATARGAALLALERLGAIDDALAFAVATETA
jgi:gluconokinase